MSIGSFGSINFEANTNKILTINDLSVNEGARWIKHELNNVAQRSEYLGRNPVEISLKIGLKASMGVNPTEVYKVFQEMLRAGAVETFVLGKEVIGKFYIEGLDHEKKYIDNFGIVWDIGLSVKLSEYCEETLEEVKKTSNTYKEKSKKNLDYNTGQVK